MPPMLNKGKGTINLFNENTKEPSGTLSGLLYIMYILDQYTAGIFISLLHTTPNSQQEYEREIDP